MRLPVVAALPVELWCSIAGHLRGNPNAMACYSCVSKFHRRVATPLLFSELTVYTRDPTKHVEAFVQLAEDHPDIVGSICDLTLRDGHRWQPSVLNTYLLLRILRRATRLRRLTLSCPRFRITDLSAHFPHGFPSFNIDYLELDIQDSEVAEKGYPCPVVFTMSLLSLFDTIGCLVLVCLPSDDARCICVPMHNQLEHPRRRQLTDEYFTEMNQLPNHTLPNPTLLKGLQLKWRSEHYCVSRFMIQTVLRSCNLEDMITVSVPYDYRFADVYDKVLHPVGPQLTHCMVSLRSQFESVPEPTALPFWKTSTFFSSWTSLTSLEISDSVRSPSLNREPHTFLVFEDLLSVIPTIRLASLTVRFAIHRRPVNNGYKITPPLYYAISCSVNWPAFRAVLQRCTRLCTLAVTMKVFGTRYTEFEAYRVGKWAEEIMREELDEWAAIGVFEGSAYVDNCIRPNHLLDSFAAK